MIGRRGRCTAPVRPSMHIAFLTGIWPPDVGGPATHGPDFARFLVGRGHTVHVVTMGDGEPAERPCEVEVVSRRLPFPVRYGRVALLGARAARHADVLYASATYAAAAAAAGAARRPFVAKLVSDPAYERAQRYGRFHGSLEEFQDASTPAVRVLKALRTRALRAARTIVVPSAYLAEIAAGWGLRRDRLHVLTNPADGATTGGVARQSGLSARTLERLFRAETGMSFGLWRQKARLLESVRLLAQGGSVTDAALDSGYSSVSAYIAAFKQTFGCTPGAMLTEQAGA